MTGSITPDSVDVERLARETLTGDLRDAVLELLKARHNAPPWYLRPAAEQPAVVGDIERTAKALVLRHGACAESARMA